MRICPKCSFLNEECFPTCVYCNRSLADVPITTAADPEHPEHGRQAAIKERFQRARRQQRSAGILYALTIAVTALIAGFVTDPVALSLYAAAGVLVAFCVVRGLGGQF